MRRVALARRALLLALAVAAACGLTPRVAAAGKVVVLLSGHLPAYEEATRGFVAAYPQGATMLSIEDDDPARVEERVRGLHPEAIVSVGLRATLFTRERFPRTPTVFCVVPDPDRFGLRGDWITGVGTDVPPAGQIAALKETVPGATRVGLVYGRNTGAALVRRIRIAAQQAHLTLVEIPIGQLSELPAATHDLAARVDVLWLPPDPTIATAEGFRTILRWSLTERRPLMVFSESLVRAGALFAVSPDYAWVGGRAAELVRRIQTGERAGDINVLPLERTRLIVNPATARTLGLHMPSDAFGAVEVAP
jgi:ABC-type uncharacterized transport system substrate-binding protein